MAAPVSPAVFTAFPLGKTGGLIEAYWTAGKSTAGYGSFRWVKPAASLKHQKACPAQSKHGTRFRWVKPAASLKLDLVAFFALPSGLVSAG